MGKKRSSDKSLSKTNTILLVIAIIVIVVLIVLVASSKKSSSSTSSKAVYVPKPSLYVDEDWKFTLGLTKGFYGRFTGTIYNRGDASAQNVVVNCMVKRSGSIIGSEQQFVGDISAGSSRSFAMDVDFGGNKEASGYCTADCTNC